MKINLYENDRPVKVGKWVRNIIEARSYTQWWKEHFGQDVHFVICP